VINTILSAPGPAFFGLFVMAAGVPGYWWTQIGSRGSIGDTLLSFRGRVGRRTFWGVIALVVVVNIMLVTASLLVSGSSGLPPLYGVRLLVIVPSVWIALAIHVKRWHDADRSAWMTLMLLIPFVNLLVLVGLGLLPGSEGPNQYGPSPQPNAGPAASHGFGSRV
jgi:uncharacterized membrane protein YhaH (DUF805 family)